jgi:hypothetical protein
VKETLSRYIRSLTEQEQAGDAPERRQDLGTFVDWLLERQGFTIHLRTFKHEGPARVKNSGKIQYGVDILASRPDSDGEPRLYYFVLKEGKFGRAEWGASEQGSMIHDLWLAAERNRQLDGWYTLEDIPFKGFTVVAVHNGDLDREDLAAHVAELQAKFRRRDITLEWWDAGRLVELALEHVPGHEVPYLQQGADASLFPPGVRPFVRGALDSLRCTEGRAFELAAVDRLLDEVLPLGHAAVKTGSDTRLVEGNSVEPRFLRRLLSELALFAKMVEIESTRVAQDSTLPVLETLERILCRAMEHARRTPRERFGEHRKPIEELFQALLEQYLERAEVLLERLNPLRAVPHGLALRSSSELVDYPLRALRLGAHLATAGLALLLDATTPQPGRAQRFAKALHDLWRHNEGGFANPVTDDQIIELGLIWELWLRSGMHSEAIETATSLLNRLMLRKAFHFPLPALYQSARVPMKDEHAQTLVETYLRPLSAAPPAFEDRGSTIVPLAIYLAQKGGGVHDELLQSLAEPRSLSPQGEHAEERMERPLHLQSWMPPKDAATAWYANGLESSGLMRVFDVSRGIAGLVKHFLAFNQPLLKSPAEEWGLPIIDRMAWKLWRALPPMALFISLTETAPSLPPAEADQTGS